MLCYSRGNKRVGLNCRNKIVFGLGLGSAGGQAPALAPVRHRSDTGSDGLWVGACPSPRGGTRGELSPRQEARDVGEGWRGGDSGGGDGHGWWRYGVMGMGVGNG